MHVRNIGSPHAGQRRSPIGGFGQRNLRGCGMITSQRVFLMGPAYSQTISTEIDFDKCSSADNFAMQQAAASKAVPEQD
jgi:hypothetical protein